MPIRNPRPFTGRPAVSSIIRSGARRRTRPRFRPDVLALEARALLSTLTVTNDNDSGTGSLRAELAAASPGDTIKFAPSAYGTIDLTSGPLQVATSVTIQGPGANKVTVSGGGQSTVFDVASGVTATISGLTVADGSSTTSGGYGAGGILNQGTLTLSRDVVTGNSGTSSSFGAAGITNQGMLTISGSTISGNSGYFAGGIVNTGALTITGSTLSGNSSSQLGAGLYTFTSASLTRCVVSGNTGVGLSVSGGGYGYPTSVLSVTDCTIVGNTNDQGSSLAFGAGISDAGAVLDVTDSTIAGNTCEGGLPQGAGIFVTTGELPTSAAALTVTRSTFQGNQVIASGGARRASAGRSTPMPTRPSR